MPTMPMQSRDKHRVCREASDPAGSSAALAEGLGEMFIGQRLWSWEVKW